MATGDDGGGKEAGATGQTTGINGDNAEKTAGHDGDEGGDNKKAAPAPAVVNTPAPATTEKKHELLEMFLDSYAQVQAFK